LAKPRFVLLDGLHVRLDIESREAFLKMYRELAKSTGTSFVIVEVNDFADSNTRARFDQVVELGAEEAGVAKLSPRAALGDKKLTLTNLSAITGRRVLYKIDELVISRGQITCLTGTNGAGKSTLLRDLQTRLATDHQVTLLPEFSSDLLIFGTVGEELQNAASNAADLLKLLGFELPSVAHTRDLSSAQRLALSLCIQLAKPSQVLLLDEPSHAFSAETGGKLIDLLRDISSDRAIVVVSHDKNLIAAADRVLNLHDGRLTEVPR
jgi:ABC-type lipoprotein export system ATPase subunit